MLVLSVRGEKWDVTEFADRHPGGRDILVRYCALVDCTEQFERLHPHWFLRAILGEHKRIGTAPPMSSSCSSTLTWLSLSDIESEAKQKLPLQTYNYFSTGAEDEATLRANEEQFRRYSWFVPATLLLVHSDSVPSTSTSLWGLEFNSPLMLCATAMQQLANSARAELAPCAAAQSRNIPYMVPHLSSKPWEELQSAPFLQLYLPERLGAKFQQVLDRAARCGFVALFITVDSARVGKRERDLRSRGDGTATSPRAAATANWKTLISLQDLREVRRRTKLRIVLKGVQRGEDAIAAIEQGGVDGIMVSNHGARNLDGARPTLASLVDVDAALKSRGLRHKTKLFFDGGVRRGGDVCKALCLGADMVGVGRPMLYASAAGDGQPGVERMIDLLHEEMHTTMALLGCPTVKQLVRDRVEYPKSYL